MKEFLIFDREKNKESIGCNHSFLGGLIGYSYDQRLGAVLYWCDV